MAPRTGDAGSPAGIRLADAPPADSPRDVSALRARPDLLGRRARGRGVQRAPEPAVARGLRPPPGGRAPAPAPPPPARFPIRRRRRAPAPRITLRSLRAAGEVDRREEQSPRAVFDVVDRRELLLAVAAPVVRRHEDHPGRSDRGHVLGVVAGAREDPPMARAGRPGGALDRVDDRAVERGIRHAPVVLEVVADPLTLAGLAHDRLEERAPAVERRVARIAHV